MLLLFTISRRYYAPFTRTPVTVRRTDTLLVSITLYNKIMIKYQRAYLKSLFLRNKNVSSWPRYI